MVDRSQEQALALLREAKEKGTLDPSIEAGLAELIGSQARSKLEKTLGAGSAKSTDATELIKKLDLEPQYSERLKTLKYYGFLSQAKKCNIRVPSFEEIMNTLKPNELEIASHFQKPTLLLIPEVSFSVMVDALDTRKLGKQEHDTLVDEIYADSDSGSDKITGWRAVIVDGAEKMEPYEDDYLNLEFGERIENRRELHKLGEKGMDRRKYALLIMEAIRSGKVKNEESMLTLLDDDPAMSSSDVLVAGFGIRRVEFIKSGHYYADKRIQFRSSVGGDVLLK